MIREQDVLMWSAYCPQCGWESSLYQWKHQAKEAMADHREVAHPKKREEAPK